MATSWSVAPYKARPTWTMTDGTEIECPMIETTPSQRRWRVQGTSQSVSQHDLSQAITRYMREASARQGKTPWFVNLDAQEAVNIHRSASGVGAGFTDFDHEVELSLSNRGTYTVAFEFQCKDVPQLTAILWVALGVASNMQMTTTSTITYRVTDASSPETKTMARILERNGVHVPEVTWPLDEVRHRANPRVAVESFAEMMRWAADVDTLTLPDGRTRASSLTYHFTRSNYSTDTYRRALDFVDAGPSMERLNQLLRGVRDELRTLGIVTDLKKDFDLDRLNHGDLTQLQLHMLPQDVADENDPRSDDKLNGLDRHHTLALDLVHGTFVVKCTRQHLEDVAAGWEVAKFKAEMSGESDVLLAYAEAFNMAAEQDRLRKVILQRKPSKAKKK